MSTTLDRIAEKARKDRKLRFTSLAHLITPEFLVETWSMMNKQGASGVDGETAREFEQDLSERCQSIVDRLKANKYKAPPVRRVEIPKGNGKMRLLGIPTVEDRVVQRAVARILEAIYEADFLECSYGFRPGRNPHRALAKTREYVMAKKVDWVFETDIRGYFDNINHEWLRKFLALRVGDPVIMRLIGKWLNAGVMQNGVVQRASLGTPQGGPSSPLLANVYLHYALDVWFEHGFKKTCRGEAYLVRFADDFIVCFQYRHEAERFKREITARMAKFGLEMAEEKTRLIRFGRFAARDEAKQGKKPEKFEFLGFEHICGTDRKGRFALIYKPRRKSCRKFLDRTHAWLQAHMHETLEKQQLQLTLMLSGFYQYFGLPQCYNRLMWVQNEVRHQWVHALRRRSQRHRIHWENVMIRPWYALPNPRIVHRNV